LFSICVANIWFISPNGNDATGQGTLQHPFQSIQEGITHMSPYDTIMLLKGSYSGSKNTQLHLQFPVTITSMSGPEATTINADGNTAFYIETTKFTIDGITFENSQALYIYQQKPMLILMNNCVVTNSATSISVYQSMGTLQLTGCNIYNCHQGIYCYGASTIIIEESSITNNTLSSFNPNGGAIYSQACTFHIYNSTISNNIIKPSNGQGGGLYFYQNSAIRVSSSVISGNQANDGGGFFCGSSSTADFVDTIIVDNSASIGGGGDCDPTCILTWRNCFVENNNSTSSNGSCKWNDESM